MQTITQDGGALTWTAHCWRHFSHYEEACDSLESAIGFLNAGEDWGNLSSEKIVCPDGTVYDEDQIFELRWAYKDGWRGPEILRRALPETAG